jgi:hypothetical protein
MHGDHDMGMGMCASNTAVDGSSFRSGEFVGSGVCAGCHDGIRDVAGNDVSLRRDWSATMMANSTRDPFWRAKVESELRRAPSLSVQLNEECTRCHAPMAHVDARAAGTPIGVFQAGFLNPDHPNHAAALEGVGCTLCHRIADDPSSGKPEGFSGGYVLSRERVLFGPYRDVFTMPMQHRVGFTPAYGAQTQRSELCATCHNLRTPVADASGRIVRAGPADGFPEQMPYTEWLASAFAQTRSCQDCHMGRTDGVVMATHPPHHSTVRDRFALHGFAGGNRLMLELLQANRTQLGVADETDFAAILLKTDRLLASAAALELISTQLRASVLEVRVRVRNLSGHKLPTSFPSRRVVVHFVVSDARGDVLFESGRALPDGSIAGDDAQLAPGQRFEPHYDVIEHPDQVQIYESVMGDLDGRVTYTLLRGASYLKDNRVLPPGAVKAALPPEIAVAGAARDDGNFIDGADQITYRVHGIPAGARLRVRAELDYQPLAAPFAADLFADAGAEGRRFGEMFERAPQKTFKLVEVTAELPVPP